jgi:hypothetical protein
MITQHIFSPDSAENPKAVSLVTFVYQPLTGCADDAPTFLRQHWLPKLKCAVLLGTLRCIHEGIIPSMFTRVAQ